MMPFVSSLACESEQLGERLNNSLRDLVDGHDRGEPFVGLRRRRSGDAFNARKERGRGHTESLDRFDERLDRWAKVVVRLQFRDRALM